MSKQKINRFVGSIGAFIGSLYLLLIFHKLSQTYKEVKVNLSSRFFAVSCLIWVIYGWTKEPKMIYFFY